jgi:hypothetical protein
MFFAAIENFQCFLRYIDTFLYIASIFVMNQAIVAVSVLNCNTIAQGVED